MNLYNFLSKMSQDELQEVIDNCNELKYKLEAQDEILEHMTERDPARAPQKQFRIANM